LKRQSCYGSSLENSGHFLSCKPSKEKDQKNRNSLKKISISQHKADGSLPHPRPRLHNRNRFSNGGTGRLNKLVTANQAAQDTPLESNFLTNPRRSSRRKDFVPDATGDRQRRRSRRPRRPPHQSYRTVTPAGGRSFLAPAHPLCLSAWVMQATATEPSSGGG